MPSDKPVFGPFHEETRKLPEVHTRYLNVDYTPKVGDVWVFFDHSHGTSVQWEILKIENDSGFIRALTGEETGYESWWNLVEFKKKNWRCLGPNHEYLWACPECEENHPVRMGDYMCIECRSALDSA